MSPYPWESREFDQKATEKDIELGFRLFLARKPDEGDLEALGNAIASDWNVEVLVRSFLSSLEFKNTKLPMLLGSQRDQQGTAATNPFDAPAAEEDVYYCYRLLLGRNPDPNGWQTYLGSVNQGWSLGHLVRTFLSSEEFKARGLSRPLLPAKPESIRMKGGFDLYIYSNDDVIGGYIRQKKEFEPHVTQVIKTKLFKGATFVDIGANVGYYTVLGAKEVGPEGTVVAYEPFQPNVSLLYMNVKANNLSNVHIYPFAAAEKRTAFVAYSVDGNAGLREFSGNLEDMPTRDIVLSATLDETLSWVSRVDVIKIDVEGSEFRALTGGLAVIRKHRPIIFSEFLPNALKVASNVSGEEYLELFLELDYTLSLISEEGKLIECGTEIQIILDRYNSGAGDHLDFMASPK
jgi:FkbM family methyltransferase